MTERLLILEDTVSQLREVESALLQPFRFVTAGRDADVASVIGGKVTASLVIVDFNAYGQVQMKLLREIRDLRPMVPMIVLVPFGEDGVKQKLFAMGVDYVLVKPVAIDSLGHAIHTLLKVQRMSALIARLERQVEGVVQFSDIVGYSAPIRQAVALAEHVAANGRAALIEGENGTGKTQMARAMHGRMCAGAPFITLDCEHLPAAAAEAIFAPGTGKVDAARGGMLFIREAGLLPQALQALLLERLEAEDTALQVIASSSVALEGLIRKGLFHAGLYRVIRKAYIPMPNLHERREDIALLAQHFLDVHTARDNKFISHFSEDALRALVNSEWPGNVAQLSALVCRCSMLCNHDTIDAGTLRMVQHLEPVHYAGQMQMLANDMPSMVDAQGKIKKLKSIEEEAIRYALSHFGGSMTKAAKSLGIGRSTLYRRMTDKDQMARANQTTRPMMTMSSRDFS